LQRQSKQVCDCSRRDCSVAAILARAKALAERRCGVSARIAVIHEVGLDGFWVHRWLEAHSVESYVVDPALITVDQRSRRVKTDRIDVEKLLHTLMAWARGMVRPRGPEQEDDRRLTRKRETLIGERNPAR